MLKNTKSLINIIELMGIGSMLPFVISLASAINMINAFSGYDIELFGGLWSVAGMAFVMSMIFVSIVSAMNFINYYKLFIAMPMELDKIPVHMMNMVDICFLAVTLIDVIIMAAFGYGNEILFKLAFMVILYAADCLSLYISTRTGFKSYGTTGKVVSSIILFFIYIICIIAYMAEIVLIYDRAENNLFAHTNPLLIILAVTVLIAAVSRILSYKGVKSCIRQSRIYKIKTKAPKEESYV